jgi:RecA/RadA recombinase
MGQAMQPAESLAASPGQPLEHAFARLQSRWGSAVIRLGSGDQIGSSPGGARSGTVGSGSPSSIGALALAVVPEGLPGRGPSADPLAPVGREITSTGFSALDAILGPGGLPRQASAAIRGDLSSGKTTLALRCLAEAQGSGAIGAWLDFGRAFDPLEAAGRGVDLRWLLVVRPSSLAEGFEIGAALLGGRAVDLLVVDLPARLPSRGEEALRRLVARAQRAGAQLIILEPASLAGGRQATVAEATGLRLELDRSGWIRLGRDVVGQQTRVTVAKNRFGPPGRQAALEIYYLEPGERALATHHLAEA